MSSEGQNNSRFIIVCHVERRGLGPEVETSRRCRTSASADRNGSRSSDPRDPSPAPSAALGMTGICRLERSDSGVERSRVRRTFAAAIRKGSCHFTVETPRFRCASLGVTAFAVMLSGAPLGAKSKHLDSSEHSPLQYIPQCAASEGRTFECSPSPGVAADCRRKAPNRPAVMLSGGASPEVETSRPDGTFSGANRTGSRPSDRRDSSTAPAASLGMTITSSVTLSGASAESKGLEFAEHAPVRITMALDISPSRPLDCARGDKKTAERNLSAGLFIVYFSLGE